MHSQVQRVVHFIMSGIWKTNIIYDYCGDGGGGVVVVMVVAVGTANIVRVMLDKEKKQTAKAFPLKDHF